MVIKKTILIFSCAAVLTFLKAAAQEKIDLPEVEKYIGKEVNISAQVVDFDCKTDFVYLYFGNRYPYQTLTVIIKRPIKLKMDFLLGREIGSFTGFITSYSGKADSSANFGIDKIKEEVAKDQQMMIGNKMFTGHSTYNERNQVVNLNNKLVMLITNQKQISRKTTSAKVRAY